MKNIFRPLLILICSITMVTGCTKYEKDTSYNTDLYGAYDNHIGAEGSFYFSECKYILNTDNTYTFTSKETQYDETIEENSATGIISLNENISDDIIKIVLDSDTTLYKYKNMLGKLYVSEIPDKKTFDLTISTPTKNWTGSYPNEAIVFTEDGYCHSCLDITKCNDTIENHIGIYYKYIRKNNLIYFTDPNMKETDYQILYYITDSGLFIPEMYKDK